MVGPSQPYCITCNLTCTDIPSIVRHFQSSAHKKAEAKTIVGVPLDKFRAASAKELNPKCICRVCRLAFPAKRVRDRHVKQSARHRELCSCKLCDKVFLDHQALKYHNKNSLKHRKRQSAASAAAAASSSSTGVGLGQMEVYHVDDGAEEDPEAEDEGAEDDNDEYEDAYGGQVHIQAETVNRDEQEHADDDDDLSDLDATVNSIRDLSLGATEDAEPEGYQTETGDQYDSPVGDTTRTPLSQGPAQTAQPKWNIPVEGMAIDALPLGVKVKTRCICRPCELAFATKGDRLFHVKHSSQHRALCACTLCHKVFQDQSGRDSHFEACSKKHPQGTAAGNRSRQNHGPGGESRTRGRGRGRGGGPRYPRGRRVGNQGGTRRSDQQPYCWICDYEFQPSEGFMAHHKSQAHIDACMVKGFYCDLCKAVFGNEFGLQWHMLKQHENTSSSRSRRTN